MVSFFGTQFWGLVNQSDLLTSVVLGLLLVLSMISWSLFFYKLLSFRRLKRDLKRSKQQISRMRSTTTLMELHTINLFSLKSIQDIIVQVTMYTQETSEGVLSDEQWVHIQQKMDMQVEDTVYDAESGLSFLSTSAAVAPLLGLFGTVWGLVGSFMAIGAMRSADISVVAPGIAQALVTTLAGLMLAIPALMMYNYLHTGIRDIEQGMIQVYAHLSLLIRKNIKKDGYEKHTEKEKAFGRYQRDTAHTSD